MLPVTESVAVLMIVTWSLGYSSATYSWPPLGDRARSLPQPGVAMVLRTAPVAVLTTCTLVPEVPGSST